MWLRGRSSQSRRNIDFVSLCKTLHLYCVIHVQPRKRHDWNMVHCNVEQWRTCADPGIVFRGSRPDVQKTVWTTFFFFSPQLILQFTEGVQWFYNRENYTFEGSRGDPPFSKGGGSTFSTWVQMLISIEIHITCDFQGGGGGPGPLSPLWIRTWHRALKHLVMFQAFVVQTSISRVTTSVKAGISEPFEQPTLCFDKDEWTSRIEYFDPWILNECVC